MKILVNKCPDTGELFEDDKVYKNHRRKILREQRKHEKFNLAQAEFNKWLEVEKEKLHHINDVAPWFISNQRAIMDAVNSRYVTGWNCRGWDKFVPEDVFTELVITGIYEPKHSNSHNCPRNGVSNWCGNRDDLPKSYPGFKVRIYGKLVRPPQHNYRYPYSDALNIVGILTGSGGGGNDNFNYVGSIFLDDWPGLKEQIRILEEDQIVSRLKGKF